jgi:signal transduction histidine kinase
VNLIFKEAMTNSFKHSGAANVSFYLRPFGEEFEMALEDDGVGLDPASITSSNGIKNIRSRAEKTNSTLIIERMPGGHGTRVQLRFSTTKKKTYDTGNQKTRPHH